MSNQIGSQFSPAVQQHNTRLPYAFFSMRAIFRPCSLAARRSLMPRQVLIPILMLVMTVTGCLYEIRDEVNDFEFKTKNCIRAHYSWCQSKSCYRMIDHRCDFRSGFLAGYKASSFGGNGCVPSLPPPCYWKACYANPEGKEKTNAWFEGYSHGAIAAKEDGIGEMNKILAKGGNRSNTQMTEMEMPSAGGPTDSSMDSMEPTPGPTDPTLDSNETGPAAELLPAPEPASRFRN